MNAITPSPNHPRQRVVTSPHSKSRPTMNGNAACRVTEVKCGDRKEQEHHRSSSLRSIDYNPSKRRYKSRYIRFKLYCEPIHILLIFGTALVIITCILGCTVTTFNITTYEPPGIIPSRSLHVQIEQSPSDQHYIDQPLEGDNPNPKIIWLMSFPNR
jgi:hypothetical protein